MLAVGVWSHKGVDVRFHSWTQLNFDLWLRKRYARDNDQLVIMRMGTIKTRRKGLPENRRAGILSAAKHVFAQQGYSDTVVDDIAGKAGIAKGTLYLYFKSKEEIFLAALLEDCQVLDKLTRERMQSVDSWDEKIKAFVAVRVEYLEKHQDFLRIFLAEVRSMMIRRGKLPHELHQIKRDAEALLIQVFAAAIAKGEIRPVDAELAALTVLDLTHGLMERQLLGWSRPNVQSDATFAMDLLCRALQA